MDSITQGVLGAAIGEALLGKKIGNKGALLGAVIATVPDLDVFFYLFYDKLAMLSIHRGFSHSILFSVLGGGLIAMMLQRIKWLEGLSFRLLFLLAWLCLFTHQLLDVFTAYGTQLWLPFSNQRVGLDSINVVDPVYTLPLIIGLIGSLWWKRVSPQRTRFTTYGLLLSSCYLLFTLLNKARVEQFITSRLMEEQVVYHSLLTMPVGMANLNWYGVAKGKDSLYLIPYQTFTKNNFPIEAFPINEGYLDEIDTSVATTMRWFAKGFYTVDKIGERVRMYNLQVDMRGMVMDGNKKAPTRGYFEVSTINGETRFASGSIASD